MRTSSAPTRDLAALHASVLSLLRTDPPGEELPVRYYVYGAGDPGAQIKARELGFLRDCIGSGDREAIRRYAYDWIEAVQPLATGFDAPVLTIGLLRGDSLGTALCCQILIAERSARVGPRGSGCSTFAEIAGGCILSHRLDRLQAERMTSGTHIYTAEELHELGLVHEVVPDGQGEEAIRSYIGAERPSHSVRHALCRVRQRVAPVLKEELRARADAWVETILAEAG